MSFLDRPRAEAVGGETLF